MREEILMVSLFVFYFSAEFDILIFNVKYKFQKKQIGDFYNMYVRIFHEAVVLKLSEVSFFGFMLGPAHKVVFLPFCLRKSECTSLFGVIIDSCLLKSANEDVKLA